MVPEGLQYNLALLAKDIATSQEFDADGARLVFRLHRQCTSDIYGTSPPQAGIASICQLPNIEVRNTTHALKMVTPIIHTSSPCARDSTCSTLDLRRFAKTLQTNTRTTSALQSADVNVHRSPVPRSSSRPTPPAGFSTSLLRDCVNTQKSSITGTKTLTISVPCSRLDAFSPGALALARMAWRMRNCNCKRIGM